MKKEAKLYILLSIIIILSNISQLPSFHGNRYLKIIILILWMSSILFISKKIKINFKLVMVTLFCFDLFILALSVFSNQLYIKSNLFYPVNLSMFIFLICIIIGQNLKYNKILNIVNIYILSILIVAINIYLNFFLGKDWSAEGYLYGAKNSIGIIVLSALCLLLSFKKSCFNKIFKVINIIFFIYFLIVIKSRASLIGLFIIIGIYLLISPNTKYNKIYIVISGIILIIFLGNQNFNEFFINKILLNNKSATDLNSISSGRIEHIEIFLNNYVGFKTQMLGNGGQYLEAFPLTALLSYGIIGAFFIFSLALLPIYYLFKNKENKNYKELNIAVILLYIIMILNCFFEELAPFGPGVKCYSLWMFLGIYLGLVESRKEI